MTSTRVVCVFVASNAPFPSGVFESVDTAEVWVFKHGLSGTLTEYVVGTGVLEWAIQNGTFKPKPHCELDAKFVGRFTSAAMRHHHYEDGKRLA